MSKLVPDLRFEGFEGEWKKTELGTLSDLITKGTTPKIKNPVNSKINFIKVENIENGKISGTSKVDEEEHKNYLKRSILKENDILFSIAGSLGITALINKEILPANTNQALAIIRNRKLDINYLYAYLNTPRVKKYVWLNPTVGAQPNLSLKQINDMGISYPKQPEQEEIGQLFETLDNLIEDQKELLDAKEKLKKSLFQKMFPRKEEQEPKIRFERLEGKWNKEKINDFSKKNNRRNKDNNITYVESVSNKHGFISQTDQFENRVASEDLKNYYIIQQGMFAYNPSRINVGSIAYKSDSSTSVISPLYISFNLNNRISDMFFDYWLNSEQFKRQRQNSSEGSVRTTLNYDNFKNIRISLPSLPEQEKIVALFKSLDEEIQSEGEKLKSYKKLKKSLLQKMFV